MSKNHLVMALLNLLASHPFLIIIVVFIFIVTSRKLRTRSVWKLPPGPAKLPIIGNLHQLGDNLHRSLWKLSQKHGALMYLKLGQIPTVVVSSSELAKQVLRTHDLVCCSRPNLVAPAKLSYGFSDVGFSPYGDRWKELRKICITELLNNKKIFSPNFRAVREVEVDQTVRLIASYASNSLPVNLCEILSKLNCSIICRISFGKSYAKDYPILAMFKEAEGMLGSLFMADCIPFLGWVVDRLNGMHNRLERAFVNLDTMYQQLIDDRLRDGIKKQGNDTQEDILDVLLRMQRDEKYLTGDCIKGILMNIILAGTDTSSATVGWTMAELMKHPELMKKAQDEVRGHMGKKRMVEESDLENFYYLKAIIKESMRKHPSTPLLLFRETTRHLTLNGYDIPAKTMLIVNAWAIARDANSWDKPEEFNPDRFIENKDYDFELIPFGQGRRICPGRNLGLVMVELALANLLYCFDWHFPSGMTKEDMDMGETTGISVHKKSGLWLVPSIYHGMEA